MFNGRDMWSLPGRYEEWDGGKMDLSDSPDRLCEGMLFADQKRIEGVK
jgi:hypothetical protein